MTTVNVMPSATMRRQDIVAMNVRILLASTGSMKRDLAKAMGISPQSMASRLQSKADWTIDETCAAADFFGLPLMSLLDPNLSPAKALSIISERRNDNDNGDGGQLVGSDAGRRQRGSGVMFALAA